MIRMLNRLSVTTFVFTIVLFSNTCSVDGHPPGDAEGNPSDHDHIQTRSPFPRAVVLPNVDGPTPWSEKPVLDDPSRFQIAIVTDRTGGHRPGIWMKGVNKINLMRPEFVVSVGDLIEGYTDNRDQVEKEWSEFLGFIDKLDMKFFFVAGNHDLTNPMMHEVWRDHFGPEWYSFDYKDVHFICMCSEDPVARLGDKQLDWIEADLEKSKDARWTLIFLHKPLWAYADREKAAGNPDNTGWTRVEAALGERPRTVFAGHHHSYVQFDRSGMKYYQLATMGGSSRLRGESYGEFDHFVWLTMEASGPQVTNLMLDGIHPAGVVTEESIARFRRFLAETQVEVAPILIDDEAGFHEGRIDVRLTNRFDKPVTVSGRLNGIPLQGLTLDPDAIVLKADPGETAEVALTLKFNDTMPFSQLAGTGFTATLRSEELQAQTAERYIPVVIDRKFASRGITSVNVDGKLGEWGELKHATNEQSLVIGAAELWNGSGDASVKFDVRHDQQNIYVAAQVTDDKRRVGDRLELRIDGRTITARSGDTRLLDGTYRIRIEAPGEDSTTTKATLRDRRNRAVTDKMVAKTIATETGYDVELAIPASILNQFQGGDWRSLQMAATVSDVDEDGEATCRVLWRGTTDVDRRNSGYGHFVRE